MRAIKINCNISMYIEKLSQLAKMGESECLEFKKGTSQLKPALETLCAFLNNKGGTVLLGVSDSGRIVGQEVTDNTRQEIAKEINKLEPPYEVSVEYISLIEGKEVIALYAEKGTYPPYCYDGRAFVRIQSTTSRMPQHLYEQLLVKRGHLNYAWDELPSSDYDFSALDEEEIRRTVKYGVSANRISEEALNENIPDILERLKLTRNHILTNAAVLLFAKEVRPNYPQFHIKMARFQGIENTGNFIDNQSIYGNAFKVLSEANNFIRRHLAIASFYQEDGLERIDKPALPVLAVREALVNAICHRDYANRSSYISIEIYDDRLEIWSYGRLSKELTIENLKKKHKSYLHNRLVAEIFYNRGLVERWGTGTTKMIDFCKKHEIPEPEFQEYSGGLSVTFKFKKPMNSLITNTFGGSSTGHLIRPELDLSLRQHKIVEILKAEGTLSSKDIGLKLKEPISERTLRHDLATLKNLGILERKGRANSTVWCLKNRLK